MSLVENKIAELIHDRDLERFAPPYTPETFTDEEKRYLKPFFSNADQPVFIVQHLPEEVIGALSAKYSRAVKSMRRTFIDEYVNPIIYPENQKNWKFLNREEKLEELKNKQEFERAIEGYEIGGVDYVVNVQRGRKFFDKWLVEFGDDSISEMGGIHLCIEGLSNIATKEIEDRRIGISPIEKSSRYVSFDEKLPDGNYRYVIPGEIKDTLYEEPYCKTMDLLFSTYANLEEPYLEYIKKLYPRGEDETLESFEKSRKAKMFDDIRDLLPFSTMTNLALFGNGRAFEYLINKLSKHKLGELRYWGKKIKDEINNVTPSFIRRIDTPIGQGIQDFLKEDKDLKDKISAEVFPRSSIVEGKTGATLVNYSKSGEIDVLAAYIFGGSNSPSLEDVRKKILKMSKEKRREIFSRIFDLRSLDNPNPKREDVRHIKMPRAFENSKYLFSVWARGGDYRDLQRHRMLTQERQLFTTKWGYDLEEEVKNSKFISSIEKSLQIANTTFQILKSEFPDAAQYLVPFAYIQHWYAHLNAREMYYQGELRTGPQGRPHYRHVVQEMARRVMEVHPDMFAGMKIDWNEYSLARRESAIWTEKRTKELNNHAGKS